jgi:hypothetical protein
MTDVMKRARIAAAEVLQDSELPIGTYIDTERLVRAVLMALREPTQEMGLAFARYWHDNFREDHVFEDTPAKECWQSMIDATPAKEDSGHDK